METAAATPSPAAAVAPPALVDAFGFTSARGDAAGAPAPYEDASAVAPATSPWSLAALAAEEGWWASDFALYIAWQQSTHPVALPAPSASCAADVDVTLIKKWFWERWLGRLRASRGCPHASLRPLLWGFFAGVWRMPAAAQEAQACQYAALVRDMDSTKAAAAAATVPVSGSVQAAPGRAVLDAIERDVSRTFPSHLLFSGTLDDAVGQQQLRRVLAAYAAVDGEVGYCQGMAFVAGVLLLAMPETVAFQVLCGLMRDCDDAGEGPSSPPSAQAPRGSAESWYVGGGVHGLRQLYLGGFPLLQVLLRELEAHVAALLPALAAHLRAHDVHVDMFASQWFLTLFAHQLPPPVLLRVWDFFVASGWPVMVQVALGLLHQEQETLLALTLEGVLLHLKEVRSRPQSEAELLRRVCSVPSLS